MYKGGLKFTLSPLRFTWVVIEVEKSSLEDSRVIGDEGEQNARCWREEKNKRDNGKMRQRELQIEPKWSKHHHPMVPRPNEWQQQVVMGRRIEAVVFVVLNAPVVYCYGYDKALWWPGVILPFDILSLLNVIVWHMGQYTLWVSCFCPWQWARPQHFDFQPSIE